MEKIGLNTFKTFKGNSYPVQKHNTIPSADTFVPEIIYDDFQTSEDVKNKRKRFKKACLGMLSALILAYGGLVLHRKNSKPALEEVQKCFKEIFEKDLSAEEIKNLLTKYKEICKESSTDDFIKKVIDQLKKDYGIENIKTDVEIIKSGGVDRKNLGSSNVSGNIKFFPDTISNYISRRVQKEAFSTGFHEIKHMKQFAEAYKTDPDKFARAVLFSSKESLKAIDESTERVKESIEELVRREKIKFPKLSDNKIRQQIMKNSGYKTEDDIREKVIKNTIKMMRNEYDKVYGKTELYKKGTEEYKKGMEYIRALENYPDPNSDYTVYKNNLLEKEALQIGEYAKKIYKYVSSVWKL